MQGRNGRCAAAIAAVLVALGALAGVAAADGSSVVGQWRFDEASGQSAIDDGPFGLDGRLGTSTAADDRDPARIAGVTGGALRFDGRTFVRLPTAAELEPSTLTLEAVVRAPASPGQFRYVVSRGAQGCIAGSYGLYTAANGGIAFYVFDGEDYRVTAEAAPADIWNGSWHHVAGVFDGHALRLYVDGHPVGDPIAAPPSIAYALTSADAYFGTYQGTCALPLTGDLDLVRLWHGPLAADFVGTLSDDALAEPTTATPAPDGVPVVPVATVADSQGDAAGTRSTLAAIAPGTSIASGLTQGTGSISPRITPGAPARACVVRSATKRVRAGRRTVLTVSVALRGKPLKAVRVVAIDTSSQRKLASGRTARDGRARLGVRPAHSGKVSVQAVGRTDCSTAALTVLRALRR